MSTSPYRPDIDGLRALAVLAVCVYHLDSSFLPGGFVGVDVFFAISGYLITGQLLTGAGRSPIGLPTFYQRRIARIFPSLAVMAFATLAASLVIYGNQDVASAGASCAATLLSVMNLKLIRQGNYFDLSEDAQPFMHCWSLSIEEQFYLVLPLLLLSLRRLSTMAIGTWLGVLGAASLGACVWLTSFQPTGAFYLLPTRAWELLAGCVLACVTSAWPSRAVRPGFFSVLGIAAIVLAFVITPEGPSFPGVWPLLPVLGTACILAPGKNDAIRALLSMPQLVRIGQMSYSIYLYHWPIYCFVDYCWLYSSPLTRIVLKVLLTASVASANVFLIEQPARRFLNRPGMTAIAFVFLGLTLAVGVTAGIWVRDDYYVTANRAIVAQGGLVFGSRDAATPLAGHHQASVVLIGDSTASVYGRFMRDMCAKAGWKLTILSVPADNPLPVAPGRSGSFWRDCLAVLEREKPDCVVVSCLWHAKTNTTRVATAIQEMDACVGSVVLLTVPPTLPDRATRRAIRHGSKPPFFEDERLRAGRIAAADDLQAYASEKVGIVDVARYFEEGDGAIRTLDPKGRQAFHDRAHISNYGVEMVGAAINRAVTQRLAGVHEVQPSTTSP